ncbi:uncharacterized protein LOC130590506 [Beta vulgaris subsp. vulgaris]|uniref:uncharacterized protein LOC130590506 n=1 Tax=Beta vulgaris subsp. vulgaris TaxID=3555 RepID=UPI002546C0CE|nr:uncharacterized protein LOC130590506 [Beta vulgaris subsp. vulgaris]
MTLRTPFKQGLRWMVGNGESISFWNDNWVFNYPIKNNYSPIIGSEDLMIGFFGVLLQMENIRLNQVLAASRNGLPTKKRLEMSHIFLPLECVFCNYHSEDDHHLFLDCPFMHDVLEIVNVNGVFSPLPINNSELSFIEYFGNLKSSLTLKNLNFYAIVWWFIWYARNSITFRQESFSPAKLGYMIKAYMHNLDCSYSTFSKLGCSQQVVKEAKNPRPNISWSPPPLDFVKLNFDGSKLQNGSTAYGFVIRDAVGNLLLSGANAIADNNSILVAEAWGLREGIRGALCLGANNISIEGDNLSVIQAIKRVWKIPWSINALINDASADLLKFDNYNIQHVFREANSAADWMAHHGHSTTNLCYWFESPDIAFSKIIHKDALGWPVNWVPP